MTHIEQMIKDMCPEGVVFKTLGEVCKIERGVRVVRNDLQNEGEIPVFQNSLTPLGYYHLSNTPAYTTFVISAGAAGKIGFSDIPFWAADDCLRITCPDNLNDRFLYYFLTKQQEYLLSQVRHASVPRMSKEVISNLAIPLPPLEIQERIVAILDAFSALAAELQAELQMRRKQYEYYRTQLLTPHSDCNSADNTDDCNWEWKTLGEVATLSRGKVYSKEYLRDNAGEYPVYSSQTVNNGELGRINTYDYDGKFLTWTTDGAYAGTVFRREGKFSITNVCGLISNIDKSLSIDFLFYWLNRVAKSYVYQGMGNPKLMSNIMATIKIPIPPLAEQARIVSILDKFEALTTSLSDGIPAEQAAQQKRYEYYRDKLLTFEKRP